MWTDGSNSTEVPLWLPARSILCKMMVRILTDTQWTVELPTDTSISLHTTSWTTRSYVMNDDVWYEHFRTKSDSILFHLIEKSKCWTHQPISQRVWTAMTRASFNYSDALIRKRLFHYGQENLKQSPWLQQIFASRSLFLLLQHVTDQTYTRFSRRKWISFSKNMFDKSATTKWVVLWRVKKMRVYLENDIKQESVSVTCCIFTWRLNTKIVKLMNSHENSNTKLQFTTKE